MRVTVIIFLFAAFCSPAVAQNNNQALFDVLDSTMAASKTFMLAKESRINSLKLLIDKPGQTSEQKYAINALLYKEYLKYNFDSALNYINRNLNLARSVGNTMWINETCFDLSNIFSSSGMYYESLDVLRSIQPALLPGKLKQSYYSCHHKVYAELGLYTALPEYAEGYSAISNAYRDTLISILDPDSDEALLLNAAKLQDQGKFEESRKINSLLMSRVSKDSPEFALYAFLRAISYRIENNTILEEKFLILSAIADIKNAVKDNVSLTLLAVLLYEKDQIDEAYHYIMYSLEDAKFYNSRLRYVEISKILPLISESFQIKNERQRAQLRIYAVIITILAILLILALLFMYKQMTRLSKARKSLQDANNRMNLMHNDLISVNEQLKLLNHELFESNRTKEEHIGFFLNLCSTYIDKLEDFRKLVHRKVTSGQVEDLHRLTKSNHYFDSELKEFYNNFDNTFLHLFPNFVDQFNHLLSEDQRIEMKTDELLTTELRIFALIRLGITDSSKIASFLRYSVNTIYNYRTRIRNKALVPRDDFERKVKMIGSSLET